jgi:hypothetical protein
MSSSYALIKTANLISGWTVMLNVIFSSKASQGLGNSHCLRHIVNKFYKIVFMKFR